eukprot:COSAG06_NODE_4646_length_4069_cov_3.984635_3_plen_75_part_00
MRRRLRACQAGSVWHTPRPPRATRTRTIPLVAAVVVVAVVVVTAVAVVAVATAAPAAALRGACRRCCCDPRRRT